MSLKYPEISRVHDARVQDAHIFTDNQEPPQYVAVWFEPGQDIHHMPTDDALALAYGPMGDKRLRHWADSYEELETDEAQNHSRRTAGDLEFSAEYTAELPWNPGARGPEVAEAAAAEIARHLFALAAMRHPEVDA